MDVRTLKELLIRELKDLYSAEKQVVRALSRLAKAASIPILQQVLLKHLEETHGHVARLETISSILGKRLTGKTCIGMRGILSDGSNIVEDTEKGIIRDAALIAVSKRVEHYEMAGYESAREFANHLGHTNIAILLNETYLEKESADDVLTGIAKQINAEAMQIS